jgi:acetolactate synthase-1/3 small subunit
VLRIVDLFNGKVADAGMSHLIVEVSGEQEEVQTILNLLKPYGIKKLARTGPIGLIREPK